MDISHGNLTNYRDGKSDETTEFVVYVDLDVQDEGSDSDMPENIWNEIVERRRNNFGA
nr:hypothetical protein [uncultured Cupriavidus sp.]